MKSYQENARNQNYNHRSHNYQSNSKRFVQKLSLKASSQYNNASTRQNALKRNNLNSKLAKKNAWFKVIIQNSSQLDKSFILNSIKSLCDQNRFIAYQYQLQGNNCVFFVRGNDTAHAIFSCNMRITSPSGSVLKINVFETDEPTSTPLSKNICEKIFQLIQTRYDAETKTLNLEEICADPLFTTEETYISLNKKVVIDTFLAAIKELKIDVIFIHIASFC